MSLFIHEFVHIVISLLVFFLILKKTKNFLPSFIGIILGGVLIDADHLIDYLFVFGTKLNLKYFGRGYQFLKSEKMYVFVHSWELVVILVLLFVFFLKNKKIIFISIFCLSLALGIFSHLISDVFLNQIPFKSYFLYIRYKNKFEIKNLLGPYNYQNLLKEKRGLEL